MSLIIFVASWLASFTLGYMLGRWGGYRDALPKRDQHGRFTKD